MSIITQLKNKFNIFSKEDTNPVNDYGGDYDRPDRLYLQRGREKTIVNAIQTRLANDVAATEIRHVIIDKQGYYIEDVDSGLNNCFNLEANIDQNSHDFITDVVQSMLEEGRIALCPIVTDIDIAHTDSYEICTMRTGKILQWKPEKVLVNVYDDRIGRRRDFWFDKTKVAILENPFWSIMNAPNSSMQRLVRKLTLLDALDEELSNGKLNMIIQLPYAAKNDIKSGQAEKRRNDLEVQLTKSKYGIGYIDGSEKIIQLNRPLENNLLDQIKFLTKQVLDEMGISENILNGTATKEDQLSYFNTLVEPILAVIVGECNRKFITKTSRTQGKVLKYFRNPFKNVTITDVATISDSLTRNEIMTSNEVRNILGYKPSANKEANELRNKNLNKSKNPTESSTIADTQLTPASVNTNKEVQNQNGENT